MELCAARRLGHRCFRPDASMSTDAARAPARTSRGCEDDIRHTLASAARPTRPEVVDLDGVVGTGSRPRSAVNSCVSRRGDGVPLVLQDEEGGLRRESYRTAVGGDRRPDRPAARCWGWREPARGALGARQAGCPADHSAGCGGRVRGLAGRARYERRPEYQRGLRNYESGLRNGYPPRRVQTAEGELSVEIPQVREAAEPFVSALFPHSRKLLRTRPLEAMVVGAFVRGLSMRDVESLCEEAGLGKVSKSTASRICQELRERFEHFKRRDLYGVRALIVMLWRAGLRISEALDLAETDLDRPRGAVLVRRGKGGRRREVGMDHWAWDQVQPWLEIRSRLPVAALLCVIHGATAGRHWEPSAARKQPRRTATLAGVRRRFAPAPAPPRSRSRDGPRGRPLGRHPAPARAREPRCHLHLPARDR